MTSSRRTSCAPEGGEGPMMKGGGFMKVKETGAKTVLVRSKLPDAEYVVNPYTGCELGCQYCYASFTGRFVSEPINNWGRYVSMRRSTRCPCSRLSWEGSTELVELHRS